MNKINLYKLSDDIFENIKPTISSLIRRVAHEINVKKEVTVCFFVSTDFCYEAGEHYVINDIKVLYRQKDGTLEEVRAKKFKGLILKELNELNFEFKNENGYSFIHALGHKKIAG